jgi:DNA-binding MarR family transcriptional regulator
MTLNSGLRRPPSLGRALNFATAAANALCNARLAAHGLTLQQWVVLSALWQRDGLAVSEIAEYTGNAGPATSRILDRMVERGLVGRQADPRDRRATRIVLAPKGAALRHLRGFHEEINALLQTGLGADEAETLSRLLAHVEANARRLGGDPGDGEG